MTSAPRPRPPRPRWLRWCRLGALCLLLGALTTGAVGWALFLNFPAPLTAANFYRSPEPWWFLRADAPGGGVVRYIWVNPGRSDTDITTLTNAGIEPRLLTGWAQLAYAHTKFWAEFYPRKNPASRGAPTPGKLPGAIDRLTGRTSAVVLDQCGWPLPALQSRIVFAIDPQKPPGHTCDWGFELPPDPAAGSGLAIPTNTSGTICELRSLPLMPAWPGALVDSSMYAAVWALLLIAPGLIARALKKPPGACKRCGYDLSGLGAGGRCPECGTAA